MDDNWYGHWVRLIEIIELFFEKLRSLIDFRLSV